MSAALRLFLPVYRVFATFGGRIAAFTLLTIAYICVLCRTRPYQTHRFTSCSIFTPILNLSPSGVQYTTLPKISFPSAIMRTGAPSANRC